jgi:hypothetical protein
MHKKLINVIRGLLSLFIEKPEIIDRVISHVNDTRLKSEADRWAEILNKAGVFVSSQELKDLNIARGGVVHTGIGRSTTSKTRMREIVVAYINTLLEIEKSE